MKLGIALYHSNIDQYPKSWVRECVNSLYMQTSQDFTIYELNYGSSHRITNEKKYRYKELPSYVEAMNEIYEWIFEDCDLVANVNVDDYYAHGRIALEVPLLQWPHNFDIVSCNYYITGEDGIVKRRTDFARLDVEKELLRGNNIVSNPGHIMKKAVFQKLKFDPALRPVEDLAYWQECIRAGFKIKIIPQAVHYRREHKMQEGNKPVMSK